MEREEPTVANINYKEKSNRIIQNYMPVCIPTKYHKRHMMSSPVTKDKILICEWKTASRRQGNTVAIGLANCSNVGELLEGPAQSPVKSIKDLLILSDYGSGPNFMSYMLPTIFNPVTYTQSKSLQKIFFSADRYLLFTKVLNLFLKELQVTGSFQMVCLHPLGLTHICLSPKYLPEPVNCEGKSFELQGQYCFTIQHTA